jgi:hypothetical protein
MFMKKLITLVAFGLYVGSVAHAGQYSGKIAGLSYYHGLLFIELTAVNRVNSPACATDNRYVFDATVNQANKTMASLVMMAYTLGKTISIVGTGQCQPGWPTESVDYVSIS